MPVPDFDNPSAFSDRSALPMPADLPAVSRSAAFLRSCRLLALPALAALVWTISAVTHHHSPLRQVRQALQEFRGESPVDPGPNQAMSAALVVRGQLLMHRISEVSADQQTLLLGILSGPADDMTQSEALDVLGIAERMHALSPAQEKEGLQAAMRILRRRPGPMVRLESARLLGHLATSSSIPALTALQGDSDPKVREAAEEALAQIKK